jgi:hypothetical protein
LLRLTAVSDNAAMQAAHRRGIAVIGPAISGGVLLRCYNSAMSKPVTRDQLCKEILRLGGSKCTLRRDWIIYLKLAGLGIMNYRMDGLTSYGQQIYFKLLRGEECPEVR